jgi:spore coat protein A
MYRTVKDTTWSYCLALFMLLAGLTAAGEVMAETTVLTPVMDNTIYGGQKGGGNPEDYTINTCGGGSIAFSGLTNDNFPRRAIVKFDLSSIPAGSTINSVALSIQVDKTKDNQSRTYSLAPLLIDWGEGMVDCAQAQGEGGRGAPANPGDATWLDAKYQQVPWNTAGGDFGAASATLNMAGGTGTRTWDSTVAGNSAMVTDVENWLATPGNNHGWIIIGDESAKASVRRFGTRESTSPPQLTIDYTPTSGTAACCFVNGDCIVETPADCTAQGGMAAPGSELSCNPNPCPQPNGACCNVDQSCSDGVDRNVCEAGGGIFQGDAITCATADCGLEPFVDTLPIPAVLQPVGTRIDGALQYDVSMTQVQQVLHRDLPPTTVWGYAGSYPGPTIEATRDIPIEVNYSNNLPAGPHYLTVDECSHGPNYWGDSKRTVAHLHGGHVPARFDGQPEYDFMPGEFDVYEYPNNQLPATLWFHDHALGITRLNVYMGLAAFYLIRDDFENALALPSGEYEIPLVIQDRKFNSDGTLFYPPTIQNQFLGDTALVNGKVWPFLNVKQGKYRFRMLNGSQARVYDLRLENLDDPAQVIPFNLIGTDGGLIDGPIPLATINAAPAERFDVVIDFAVFPAGTEIILRNDDASSPPLPNIMKFVVTSDPGYTTALPGTLRPVTPILESDAAGTRRFLLDRVDEPCAGKEWLVKSLDSAGNVIGEHWDDITEFPILGETEIWQFENPSNSMHPMHVHLVQFQILDKADLATGTPIPLQPWEINTWKDMVQVPPNSKVRVIMKFEDYPGKFPYHCHLLDHEDHEMMRQFHAIYDPANCDNDGICEIGEDCVSCPADCGQSSGASCGNGLCEAGDGENCVTCPSDCAGVQSGPGSKYCCGGNFGGNVNNPIPDCGTDANGNSCIDQAAGWFCRVMPRVSACCGDNLCEGAETGASCAADCTDSDADDVPDIIDSDDDNDGIPDATDAFPNDPAASIDTDGDGMPDTWNPGYTASDSTTGLVEDLDDDNDGLPDTTDPLPLLYNWADGDVAPWGASDTIVNGADVLVMMQFVLKLKVPTDIDLAHGDVYPVGAPDGVIGLNDFIIVQNMLLSGF